MSMNSFHSRGRRSAPAPRPAATAAAPQHIGLVRADALLVQRGLVTSRAQARAAIEAGRVRYGAETLGKASRMLPPDARLELITDAG